MRLATLSLIALIAVSASEHDATNAGLPLVESDYQNCVRISPGPLKPKPKFIGSAAITEIA